MPGSTFRWNIDCSGNEKKFLFGGFQLKKEEKYSKGTEGYTKVE